MTETSDDVIDFEKEKRRILIDEAVKDKSVLLFPKKEEQDADRE